MLLRMLQRNCESNMGIASEHLVSTRGIYAVFQVAVPVKTRLKVSQWMA